MDDANRVRPNPPTPPKNPLPPDNPAIRAKEAEIDAEVVKAKEDGIPSLPKNEKILVDDANRVRPDPPKNPLPLDNPAIKAKKAETDAEGVKAKDDVPPSDPGPVNKAVKDAENTKPPDDSDQVRKKAEDEESKAKDEDNKGKKEKTDENTLKNRLSDLLGLLGLLGLGLNLSSIFVPPPVITSNFCLENPLDSRCNIQPPLCPGPLCPCQGAFCGGPTGTVYVQPQTQPEESLNRPAQAPAPPEDEGDTSYLIFTLQSEPETDITLTLESNSDDLEFDNDTITFPKETWSEPISVPFYITLDSDINNNDEYSNLPLKDKYKSLTAIVPIIPITKSLGKYGPTKKDIDDHRKRIEYLLNDDDNYNKTITEIQNNIALKKKIKMLQQQKISFEPLRIRQEGGNEPDDIEPVYDDADYKTYEKEDEIEPLYDDADYKVYEKEDEIEPLYDDADYKVYEKEDEIEPVYKHSYYNMIGGEEPRDPDYIIDEVDYDKLSSETDPSDLSDKHVSLFTITSTDTPTSSFDVSVISASPSWGTNPDIVTFDAENISNESSIYSTNTLSALRDLAVAQGATNLTGEFTNSIDRRYNKEAKEIEDEKRKNDAEADDSYQEIYNNSLERQNYEIQEREQALYQFQQQRGGFTRKNLSKSLNKFKKTRRITK